MRRTPLYEAHVRLGAKMVDFGGWAMPVSLPDRHPRGAPRDAHRGRRVRRLPHGRGAFPRPGRRRDGPAPGHQRCRALGGRPRLLHGRVPAVGRHRRRPDRLPPAAPTTTSPSSTHRNIDKDCRLVPGASRRRLQDRRRLGARRALIAFQGPAAQQALAAAGEHPARSAARRSASPPTRRSAGCPPGSPAPATPARTASSCSARAGRGGAVGRAARAASTAGGKPVGLGARDTLRLEAQLPLYGNDIDDETHAARGRARLGREARRRRLHRQRRAARAEGRGRHAQAGRLRDDRARDRAPRLRDLDDAGAASRRRSPRAALAPTLDEEHRHRLRPDAAGGAGTKLSIDCRGKRVARRGGQAPFYKRGKKHERALSGRSQLHEGPRVGAHRGSRRHEGRDHRRHALRGRAAGRRHARRAAQGGRRSSRPRCSASSSRSRPCPICSRPSPARWSRSTRRCRIARVRQRGPVRRGLDDPGRASATRASWTACWTPRRTRRSCANRASSARRPMTSTAIGTLTVSRAPHRPRRSRRDRRCCARWASARWTS